MRILKNVIFILSGLWMSGAYASPVTWKTLMPDLSYAVINYPRKFPMPAGSIHAFKVNLETYRLNLVFTRNKQNSFVTVKDLVQQYNALIGINGGFFTPDLVPLGLRFKDSQIYHPIRKISWWGIFYIKDNKAYIVSLDDFRLDTDIQLAIQSGPRLIIDGKIPPLKPGYASRSALCITKEQQLIISATKNLPITAENFAEILRLPPAQGGLGCYNAINLDGGSSTQLFAHIGGFTLNIPSYAQVSDALLVSK